MKLSQFGQFPIDEYLEEITRMLFENNRLVLAAETGAGKTTRVPPYLLSKSKGKILVLEPRRLAASLTAARVAESLGEQLGKSVGYHIRHQRKFSSETQLLFITEGMLLRYLQNDPDLNDVEVILLDEFHERNLYTDISLAIISTLQKTRRPDLKLVVMSATLDVDRISSYLDQAPVMAIKGRAFPLEVHYREYPEFPLDKDKICACLQDILLRDGRGGNILLFTTGAREINRLKGELEDFAKIHRLELLMLYSSLSSDEQAKVFINSEKRKLILATNVAETSLTLPHVTAVIDLGEAKIAGVAPWSGMPTLEIQRVSKASCEQRAGRAGRVAPGVVYRLYSRADYSLRQEFSSPEVDCVDLSHILLELLSLGHNPFSFNWYSPPPKESLERALELLVRLHAIAPQEDKSYSLTSFGEEMATLAIHPRLSALVLHAKALDFPSHGIYAAGLLSEGEILNQVDADERDQCDLQLRLKLLKGRRMRKELNHLFDSSALHRLEDFARQLHGQLGVRDALLDEKNGEVELWKALLRAFPDRLAKKQQRMGSGGVAQYHFCQGKGGSLMRSSALFFHPPELILALDSMERLKGNAAKGIQVRFASALTMDQVLTDPGSFITQSTREEVDEQKRKIRYYQDTLYGKITLVCKQLAEGECSSQEKLAQKLMRCWPFPFTDEEYWKEYHHKLTLLNKFRVENTLPYFSGDLFQLLLESLCEGKSDLSALKGTSLKDVLWEQLGELERYQIKNLMVDWYTLINGVKLRILWENDELVLEAPLQQFYGVDTHPSLFDGKVILLLRFLSPAKRVVQTTRDLPKFWKGSYSQVQKEMRADYPKHYWPDAPSTAPPVFLKHQLIKQ